jgi:hypothetical protein
MIEPPDELVRLLAKSLIGNLSELERQQLKALITSTPQMQRCFGKWLEPEKFEEDFSEYSRIDPHKAYLKWSIQHRRN